MKSINPGSMTKSLHGCVAGRERQRERERERERKLSIIIHTKAVLMKYNVPVDHFVKISQLISLSGITSHTVVPSSHVGKATPSCTSVSGPGFFKGPCGRALHQHHSHQYKLMNAGLSSLKC